MAFYTDQIGREVEISLSPQRIISLVPSQTELLYHLGLNHEIIGITKFCIHPSQSFASKTRVGGTKNVDIDKIKALEPDLIIASKEENVKDDIEELAKYFPVWVSDVKDLLSAFAMIRNLGRITSTECKAAEIIELITDNFNNLLSFNKKFRTAYLIWKQPYMTVGGDTFINSMLERGGFENVFKKENRYPIIEIASLHHLNCELILLSSEPYPFGQKHIEEIKSLLQKKSLAPIKIALVDGEMFSWYGSRLIKAPKYFESLQKELLI